MTLLIALLSHGFAEDNAWVRCYPKGYSEEAWCQTLQAPLHQGSDKTIALSIVKLPAIRPSPQEDPLFFIAGGPGQSAIDNIALVSRSMYTIQKKRDLIFIDQRGTGSSTPLSCETPDVDPASWDSETAKEEYVTAMVSCLQDSAIPIEYFGTPYAIQDIDFVRQTLGFQEINLYGVSYGTRVAQAYMRRFPQHSRAVILDGVVPMDEPIGRQFKQDAQSVLDQIESECAQDSECQALTPSVIGDLETVLSHLSVEPLIQAPNPSTGLQSKYQLTPETILSGIRLALYSPLLQRMLPYTLHEAQKGNYTPLLAQTIQPSLRLNEDLSSGLYYAIYCAEDYPRRAQSPETITGVMNMLDANQAQEICRQIDVPTIEPAFFEPIQSDIPVLMVSGARDPITPPSLADKASLKLSAHQHIIAPQAAHNVGLEQCASGLLGRFIADPHKEAKSNCIENAEPKAWIINTSGAQP